MCTLDKGWLINKAKNVQFTCASRFIRDMISVLGRSHTHTHTPPQYRYSPLLLNFSEETHTHHNTPVLMKSPAYCLKYCFLCDSLLIEYPFIHMLFFSPFFRWRLQFLSSIESRWRAGSFLSQRVLQVCSLVKVLIMFSGPISHFFSLNTAEVLHGLLRNGQFKNWVDRSGLKNAIYLLIWSKNWLRFS